MAIGFAVFIYRSLQATDVTQNRWQWRTARWLLPYLLGLGIISYLGSFGGGTNVIKFGTDFIVIALFTIVIYFMAMRSTKLVASDADLLLVANK